MLKLGLWTMTLSMLLAPVSEALAQQQVFYGLKRVERDDLSVPLRTFVSATAEADCFIDALGPGFDSDEASDTDYIRTYSEAYTNATGDCVSSTSAPSIDISLDGDAAIGHVIDFVDLELVSQLTLDETPIAE